MKNRQVEFTNKGRYNSIRKSNGIVPDFGERMLVTEGDKYGMTVATPVATESGLGFKLLVNKHFADFDRSSDADGNYASVDVIISSTDFYTNMAMANMDNEGLSSHGIYYVPYYDADGDFTTLYPVGKVITLAEFAELEKYAVKGTTGLAAAEIQAFYKAGTTNVQGSAEEVFDNLGATLGADFIGGAFDAYNYPCKIIALKALAAAQGQTTPWDNVDNVELHKEFFECNGVKWLIIVKIDMTVPAIQS